MFSDISNSAEEAERDSSRAPDLMNSHSTCKTPIAYLLSGQADGNHGTLTDKSCFVSCNREMDHVRKADNCCLVSFLSSS